jgi:hypothetical protein
MLTTEECFLDQQTQVRNPGFTKKTMPPPFAKRSASRTLSGSATASPATTRTATWMTFAAL